MEIKALITGIAGNELAAGEIDFIAEHKPWGFILFSRNLGDPERVASLTQSLRESVGRNDAPILIDQEGGRVNRLGPPHWPDRLPARAFGDFHARDSGKAKRAAWLQSRLIGFDLRRLGITMNASPVLDVAGVGTHDSIGDRAFSRDAETVAELGREAIAGLMQGGVIPIMKHAPGQGRASSDSHEGLPKVSASLESLRKDFLPFRLNRDSPAAMTAHVAYEAIDSDSPATLSRRAIQEMIRGEIGFDGLLISDDLCMGALCGSVEDRVEASLSSGCDLALHCSGDLEEMKAAASVAGFLAGDSLKRADSALARSAEAERLADESALREEFEALRAEMQSDR